MKMIGFLITLGLMSLNLQAEEMFNYTQSMDCFVKLYENRVFKNVDDEYFVGKPLRIAELKKTPGYVAFKVNGKLYVAPKKCLVGESNLNGSEEEMASSGLASKPIDKNQEWEEENAYKQRKESIEKRKNERISESSRDYNTFQKKYFFELFGGKIFGGSSKPGIDDYQKHFKTINGYPVTVNMVGPGKSESTMFYGGKIGLKNDEKNFLYLQYKRYNIKKTDVLDITVDVSGTPVNEIGDIPFKYSINQLYVGYSFCIKCVGSFAVYANALLGINSVDLTMDDTEKFTATVPGGEISLSSMYALSDLLSLNFILGYDLQTGGTYKLKGTETSETPTGFKSDMSLGGPFASLGLRVHF